MQDALLDSRLVTDHRTEASLREDAPVAPELRAGRISLHRDRILHGSAPNRPRRCRCGPAMRYLSADARAYDGWETNAVCCRGTNDGGHRIDHLAPTATRPPPPTAPGGTRRRRLPGPLTAATPGPGRSRPAFRVSIHRLSTLESVR